jgi:hypothetical protein
MTTAQPASRPPGVCGSDGIKRSAIVSAIAACQGVSLSSDAAGRPWTEKLLRISGLVTPADVAGRCWVCPDEGGGSGGRISYGTPNLSLTHSWYSGPYRVLIDSAR